MKRFLAVCALSLASASGGAAAQEASDAGASASVAEEVEITADNFVMNEQDQSGVFTGNVVVTHPDVTVWAPRVDIRYGEGGPSDLQLFEASGDVRLQTPDQEATGDLAVFDPATQLLRLSGNVEVVNASGTMNAPELLVDLATNTSTFTGGEGGRVRAVFPGQ